MDCQLTFKKAFGLGTMPAEESNWLYEFQSATFQVKVDDKLFHISVGHMGETEHEKRAIMQFSYPDALQSIKPIRTLNFTTKLELEIPASIYARWSDPSVANSLVEPFIESAFNAYQNFAEAYRDTRYFTDRRTPRWHAQHGVFVRLRGLNYFKTYLFYVLNAPNAVTFVGSSSEGGRTLIIQPNDTALYQRIQETLNEGVPLSRLLVVNAWEALFAGDLRSSVLSAATALELIVSEFVRTKLKKSKRFVNETRNASLANMMLNFLKLGDSPLEKQAEDVFTIRNALVHRSRRNVSHEEANSAVETTETFLLLAEESNVELV